MHDFEYDIALSFANEDREYVEQVANELQFHNVKVFYDKFEEATLWGKNLYDHLDLIYRKKSKYCTIFISENYKNKQWTNHERKSAQARAFENNEDYILPVRFDNTEFPGLQSTVGYIDAKKKTPKELVAIILKKLDQEIISPENVVLRFKSNLKIDNESLLESLERYKNWSIVNISKIPITVLLPFNIQERIDSYGMILEKMIPPSITWQKAIDKAKEIYSKEYIEKYFISQIQYSIKETYKLLLTGVIELNEFSEIVEIYATSKVINYIRIILACRILDTEDENWLLEYYHLSGVFGMNLIHGLPYVIRQRENEQYLFWVDFDLYNKGIYEYTSLNDHITHYLYLPDNLIIKLNQNKKFLRKYIINYIVPQLIQYLIEHSLSKFNLSNFLKDLDNYSISLRKEMFYRIDKYEDATNAKEKLKKDFIDLVKNEDEKLLKEIYKKIIYVVF